MMAMLSLQKQNWEHGIASQAFIEAGDQQMMMLMAKEAVLRQGSDGRSTEGQAFFLKMEASYDNLHL